MSSSRVKISSVYKSDIFDLFMWHRDNIKLSPQARRTIDQIINEALSDQHDLLFLIRSIRLISQSQADVPVLLKNALYALLTQYLAGFVEATNLISLVYASTCEGLSPSLVLPFLKILIIDRFQNNLCNLFLKNKVRAETVLEAMFNAPVQLLNVSNLSSTTKSIALNACAFVKSNLSFFQKKLINARAQEDLSETVLYPPMAEIRESYFSR